jgi:hypothetical protein
MSATFVRGKNRADGQRTVGGYIGDALRHGRRAAELNPRSGPTAGVATSVRQAREALDSAGWLLEFIASEGQR